MLEYSFWVCFLLSSKVLSLKRKPTQRFSVIIDENDFICIWKWWKCLLFPSNLCRNFNHSEICSHTESSGDFGPNLICILSRIVLIFTSAVKNNHGASCRTVEVAGTAFTSAKDGNNYPSEGDKGRQEEERKERKEILKTHEIWKAFTWQELLGTSQSQCQVLVCLSPPPTHPAHPFCTPLISASKADPSPTWWRVFNWAFSQAKQSRFALGVSPLHTKTYTPKVQGVSAAK